MITKDTKTFDIYIDNIFCYANKGVIQAATFIGAILNEHNNFDIAKWNINEYWELIPQLSLDNTILLSKFKSFVVKSALCEMMMDFEQTLLKIYDSLLLVKNIKSKEQYNIKTHLESVQNFKNQSFENKLELINKIIQNKLSNIQLWQNLKYVRNCITHNNSVVDKGKIQLNIPIFFIELKDNVTGEIYRSSKEEAIIKIGRIQGHDISAKVGWDTEEKTFDIGATITFTPAEIYHLLFALKESIKDLEILFINYLVKNKIEFGITEQNGIIKTQEELEKQYKYKKELYVTLSPKLDKGAKV